MKIERAKLKQSRKFKPVTLNITIENEEELYNLYQRISACDEEIGDDINEKGEDSLFSSDTPFYECDAINYNLWQELRDIIEEKMVSGEIESSEIEEDNDN